MSLQWPGIVFLLLSTTKTFRVLMEREVDAALTLQLRLALFGQDFGADVVWEGSEEGWVWSFWFRFAVGRGCGVCVSTLWAGDEVGLC